MYNDKKRRTKDREHFNGTFDHQANAKQNVEVVRSEDDRQRKRERSNRWLDGLGRSMLIDRRNEAGRGETRVVVRTRVGDGDRS